MNQVVSHEDRAALAITVWEKLWEEPPIVNWDFMKARQKEWMATSIFCWDGFGKTVEAMQRKGFVFLWSIKGVWFGTPKFPTGLAHQKIDPLQPMTIVVACHVAALDTLAINWRTDDESA